MVISHLLHELSFVAPTGLTATGNLDYCTFFRVIRVSLYKSSKKIKMISHDDIKKNMFARR